MKLTRNLRLAAGVLAVSAIATPIVLTQLGSGSVAGAAPITLSNTSNFDEIQYNQQTGNSGTYYAFVPWSGSTAPTAGKNTTQSMTGGGGCSPGPNFPGLPPNPLLDVTAQSGGLPANVAAFKFRTGVCTSNSGQSQLITQTEGLTFGLGSGNDAIIGSNRHFIEAQIGIARQDGNLDSAQAELIESSAGVQVGEQQIQIPPGSATVIADTRCGTNAVANSEGAFAPCTGGYMKGFDSVQLLLLGSATDAISVVPTSIFYLNGTLCGGETVSVTSTDGTASSGQVSASATLPGAPKTVCKSYDLLAASANDVLDVDGVHTTKSVTFDAEPLAGQHITFTFHVNRFPYCRPDSSGSTPGQPPTCTPTFLSTDNAATWSPQVYCSAATTAIPLCTTNKSFDYVSDPGTVDITETWDGLGDSVWRW